MRTYFINPPRINPQVSSYEIPLGITTLVAAVEKFAPIVPVEILDLQLYPQLEIETLIDDELPVVCMTILSYNMELVYSLCRKIKLIKPNSLIILGGPHATLQKAKIFEESEDVDYICVGEGDFSLPFFLKNLYNGIFTCDDIPGIYSKEGTNGGENKRIQNLSSLPSIIEGIKRYDMKMVIERNGYVSYIASRGCPYDCIYCSSSNIWGHSIKFVDSQTVCEDLEWLASNNVKYINFRDDIFTVNRKWLDVVIRKLRELNITWGCETRADCLDKELLLKMKNSGCELLRLGIETFNQKTLDILKKRTNVDMVKQTLRDAIEVGITENRMSMMLGLPGETDEDVLNTLKVCREFPEVYFKFFSLYPAIGTQLYDDMEKYGINLINKQALTGHSQIETREMSNEKINEWLEFAYQEFHDPEEDYHRDFSVIFKKDGFVYKNGR